MRHTPSPPAATGRSDRPGRSGHTSHRLPPAPRRRAFALLAACGLVLAAGAVVGQDLLLGDSGLLREASSAEPARPLTEEEASRLAGMRQVNHESATAGVRVTLGGGPEPAHFAGWLDWRHPMVYLARSDPGIGEITELLQAVPGLVAVRSATDLEPPDPEASPEPGPGPESVGRYPFPPAQPPASDWQVRQPGAGGPAQAPDDPVTVDTLLGLLLASTAEYADSAQLLAGSEARWLRRDQVGGYDVDVLLGPALPTGPTRSGPELPGEPAERSLAAMGGAVRYWLDQQGQLHRLEARLTDQTTAEVDFVRDAGQDAELPVIDPLGGAAIDPRPVTDQEAELLAGLPVHNHAAGGGELTLTLPGEAGELRRATGWLDWQRQLAYLATYRDGAPDGLLLADLAGVATRSDIPPRAGQPPLPIPADAGWQLVPWLERDREHPGYELDLLINEVLSLSGWQPGDPGQVREAARWLRADELAGTAVGVYEIPHPDEAELAPGQARLRYWVDEDTGVLVRLEVRTRAGGFGQLDLVPGPPPPLG